MEQWVQQVQTRLTTPIHRYLQLYHSLYPQDINGTNKTETIMNKDLNPCLYQRNN